MKKLIVKQLNLTETEIKQILDKVEIEYRPFDPSWYLYRELLETKEISERFSNKYIELIYVTLSAWNMNSRGAQLKEFNKFKQILMDNEKDITKLSNYNIKNLTDYQIEQIIVQLQQLYLKMKLTQTQTNLVTFSKTMHFLLPDLVVPFDRKYTLQYFYNKMDLNCKGDKENKWIEEFKEYYIPFFKEVIRFSKEHKLEIYKNKSNPNIPKIIDNIIIGLGKT